MSRDYHVEGRALHGGINAVIEVVNVVPRCSGVEYSQLHRESVPVPATNVRFGPAGVRGGKAAGEKHFPKAN